MTADLLAALEAMLAAAPQTWLTSMGEELYLANEQARAAIAAHKEAHRDGADDACPCYGDGWQAGHEAERKPVGYQ